MPRKQPLLVTTDLLGMLIDKYRYFLYYLVNMILKTYVFTLVIIYCLLQSHKIGLLTDEGKQALLGMNFFRGWTENLVLSILLLSTSV